MLSERFPNISIVPISAAKGEGIDALKKMLATRMIGDKGVIFPVIKGGQARNL